LLDKLEKKLDKVVSAPSWAYGTQWCLKCLYSRSDIIPRLYKFPWRIPFPLCSLGSLLVLYGNVPEFSLARLYTQRTTKIIPTGNTPYCVSGLLNAACDGDLDKMQRLIKEGSSVHEVDSDGENAPMYATRHYHAPIVHWLVSEGGVRISDVDRDGRSALSMAITFGRYSLAQWLLELGGWRKYHRHSCGRWRA
jgi:hypothetical protein